jgi:hypothetical protein
MSCLDQMGLSTLGQLSLRFISVSVTAPPLSSPSLRRCRCRHSHKHSTGELGGQHPEVWGAYNHDRCSAPGPDGTTPPGPGQARSPGPRVRCPAKAVSRLGKVARRTLLSLVTSSQLQLDRCVVGAGVDKGHARIAHEWGRESAVASMSGL